MHHHLEGFNQKNIRIARTLRKNMTIVERKLWKGLRNNQLGIKIRRQVPYGPYILDFYCLKVRLDIEIDGSQHFSPQGMIEDRIRDAYLAEHGITVLRFTDCETRVNTIGILEAIFETIEDIKKTPSSLLPLRGEGRSS